MFRYPNQLSFTLRTLLVAASLSIAHASVAQDAQGVAGEAQVQARVVGIDPATNSVTLKGPQGRVVEIAVNPQVGDVSKLRLGDAVNIEYREALLIRATKAKPGAIRERVETDAAIPASDGVTAHARKVEVMATVEHIDAKKRLVTLRGPDRTVTLAVSPEASLEGLKKGDTVQAEFETATAVQVLRDGQPVK